MSATSHELPSALARLDEIAGLAAGRPLMIFLDYDGTLTPIVERPELAVLSEPVRETVRRLSSTMRVAIVSGRGLDDVKTLVGLDSVFYAGSHGYEVEGPGGWHLDLEQARHHLPAIEGAESLLRGQLSSIDGAIVERKRFSVAVHYRLVSARDLGRVRRAVGAARSAWPGLRRTGGKKVFELQPDIEWNKGKALLWLLEALGLGPASTLPLFIGDDITDEDAFGAIRESGVGIIVRDEPRPTRARYALASPAEVREFLARLATEW